MNFKERLELTNSKYNSQPTHKAEDLIIKDNFDLINIFERNEQSENILSEILKTNKNIILICSKEYDNELFCNYIRNFIDKSKSVEVLSNVSDNLHYISASKVIAIDPDIKETIKILELILTGLKSFIFTINIKNYNNVLESIRTLISLNATYLSQNAINHLIAESDSVMVFFERNSDGLFYVKNIEEVQSSENNIVLNSLFEYEIKENDKVTKETQKKKTIKKKEKIQKEEENKSTLKSEINDTEENKQVNNQKHIITNKVNKYKLLKIKYNKKNNSNSL